MDHIQCSAKPGNTPLSSRRVTEKLEKMIRRGILEPVQPGVVNNASSVVWQRKKSGELRLRGLEIAYQWQGHG